MSNTQATQNIRNRKAGHIGREIKNDKMSVNSDDSDVDIKDGGSFSTFMAIMFGVVSAMIFSMIYYYYIIHYESNDDNIDTTNNWRMEFDGYPYETELRNISNYDKLVAIGDLHGDLNQIKRILMELDIINNKSEWIANNTILVQTGDMFDRGTDSIGVLELFISLRKESIQYNSLVLQILGNHEHMNLVGDYRYVHKNELYKYGGIKNWSKMMEYNQRIGYFLRNTPIIRIVGDNLFVHAGLKPDILSYFDNDIHKINSIFKEAMISDDFNQNHPTFYDSVTITSSNGPLWTREFEPNYYDHSMLQKIMKNTKKDTTKVSQRLIIESYVCDQVSLVLKKLNVSRMFIGHNPQRTGIIDKKCSGQLYSIDVGISSHYGGNIGAIIIDIESNLLSIFP